MNTIYLPSIFLVNLQCFDPNHHMNISASISFVNQIWPIPRISGSSPFFKDVQSHFFEKSGCWFGCHFLFSQKYWESSSQLTFIFFRGAQTTNQETFQFGDFQLSQFSNDSRRVERRNFLPLTCFVLTARSSVHGDMVTLAAQYLADSRSARNRRKPVGKTTCQRGKSQQIHAGDTLLVGGLEHEF